MTEVFNQKQFLERRRILRNQPTKSEHVLWTRLRDKSLGGFRFRRQCGIGPYIVDFYCPKARLVIEVDGGYHTETETHMNDIHRQQTIEALGLTVVRFTDKDILERIDFVVDSIRNNLPLAKGELRG